MPSIAICAVICCSHEERKLPTAMDLIFSLLHPLFETECEPMTVYKTDSGVGAGDPVMNIPHSRRLYSRGMSLTCGTYLWNIIAKNKMN